MVIDIDELNKVILSGKLSGPGQKLSVQGRTVWTYGIWGSRNQWDIVEDFGKPYETTLGTIKKTLHGYTATPKLNPFLEKTFQQPKDAIKYIVSLS